MIIRGKRGRAAGTQAFDPIPWSRANGGPTLRRIVADAATGEVLEATKLSDTKLDMPTFHPGRDGLPNKVLFGTAGVRPDGWFPFNALVKYDLEDDVEEVWHAGDDAVTSEPYFVPRDDDTDDGEGVRPGRHPSNRERSNEGDPRRGRGAATPGLGRAASRSRRRRSAPQTIHIAAAAPTRVFHGISTWQSRRRRGPSLRTIHVAAAASHRRATRDPKRNDPSANRRLGPLARP